MSLLGEKFKEVMTSTIPIVLLVAFLAIFVLELPMDQILMFGLCVVMVIAGFTIFLSGVDWGIHPMGTSIGQEIPRRKSKMFMIVIVFMISFLVTVAEPDVTVFGSQVHSLFSSIDPTTLTYAIAIGVAAFLIVAAFRIIYRLSLKMLITIGYVAVILLVVTMDATGSTEFIGIALDSGGVTTGPVTVPILLALGIGICSMGHSKDSMDGFGMIGLASIGPVLAVLVLGLMSGGGSEEGITSTVAHNTIDFELMFTELKNSAISVAYALIPLMIFFVIFQRVFLKYSWTAVSVVLEGTAIAGVGIIIFLAGVYTGFMPIATSLGMKLGDMASDQWFMIVGLGFLMGFLVASAEPAVSILGDQVEESSGGVLSKKLIIAIISIGVAAFVAIGMAKLVFNINLAYIVVPGLILTLIVMWIGDKDMVGIAFDAGGVATGPMSVAILSSFYVGFSSSIYTGTQAVIYGFGLICLIALAPCLFLSLLGLYTKYKKSKEDDIYYG